jgi:AraC family transcriptional activator of pyochelin receptor
MEEANEILDSDHYGALRPMFLESRALSWLATALAGREEARSSRPPAREIDRMHHARDLLLSRLADPPTLAEVATAVGTNDVALKRNFKAVFGQPVYGYLLDVRLNQARRLLEDTSDCQRNGGGGRLRASHHFSTAFRRSHGVSPAHYRAGARR